MRPDIEPNSFSVLAKNLMARFAIGTKSGVKYVTVLRDDDFWNRSEQNLTNFWVACLAPEIIDSRYNRHLPIREPETVPQGQAKKNLQRTMIITEEKPKVHSQSTLLLNRKRKTTMTYRRFTSWSFQESNSDWPGS